MIILLSPGLKIIAKNFLGLKNTKISKIWDITLKDEVIKDFFVEEGKKVRKWISSNDFTLIKRAWLKYLIRRMK